VPSAIRALTTSVSNIQATRAILKVAVPAAGGLLTGTATVKTLPSIQAIAIT
jgi:hypothetical protein